MATIEQTHYADYNHQFYPLHRENKTTYPWLLELLNNELNMLANITEERIKLRDTRNQISGLEAMLYNAGTVVEKVREYELPKLRVTKEIQEVDRLLTLILEYIGKVEKMMKKK